MITSYSTRDVWLVYFSSSWDENSQGEIFTDKDQAIKYALALNQNANNTSARRGMMGLYIVIRLQDRLDELARIIENSQKDM